MKQNKLTTSYLRFHNQLMALKKGKMDLVRRFGSEARREIEMKAGMNQLHLRYSI